MQALLNDLMDFGHAWSPICVPIAAALGIIAIIASFRLGKTVQDMANWKTTKGQLLGCRTVTIVHKRRSGFTTVETGQTHYVEIRYRYLVDGIEYVGTRFKIAQSQISVSTRREGERLTSKIKAEPQMDVHYDPKDPSLAVLIRTAPGDHTDPTSSNFWGGIILISAAVTMFIIFRPYGF